MPRPRAYTFFVLLGTIAFAGVTGCSTGSNPGSKTRLFDDGDGLRLRENVDASTRRKATLALADIEPKLQTPSARPATLGDAKPAPAQALLFYAQGRRALADGERFTAIKRLEQVIALDPLSPAPYVLLAQAQLADGVFHDKSIAALVTAAELDPTDVSVQTELGRQLLAKGDVANAITHLRLAIETPGYTAHVDDSALADLYLAKALDKGGYDRAAVERYELLLAKLKTRELSLRRDAELSVLVANPDLVSLEVGKLHERRGQYAEALAALEPIAADAPGNFELQAKVVQLMNRVGRTDEAAERAAGLVTRFRASRPSVDLLREVSRGRGKDKDAAAQLRALIKANPTDRTLVFALADVLRADGRDAEATQLLVDALGKTSADVEITRRLFAVYDARNDVVASAKLLVETVARQPELATELSPLWDKLTNPLRPGRLRRETVDGLAVASGAVAAKLYFLAQSPELARHPVVVRQTLQMAIDRGGNVPFEPAYRALHAAIFSAANPDDAARKAADAKKLSDAAAATGDVALASELRGRALAQREDQAADAAREFRKAIKADGNRVASPDRVIAAAAAYGASGQSDRARQMLWKLVSDRPTLDAGYEALFTSYLTAGETAAAVKVVTSWLATDPTSVEARLLQATVFRQSGHPEAAERVLLDLLDEQPTESRVLTDFYLLYTSTGREDQFVTKLEALRRQDPKNLAAGELLVEVYAGRRNADAARVLDALRDAATNDPSSLSTDPDGLYAFASQYTRIDQPEAAERLLEQAVAHDPRHAGASNDLGYAWADAGKNLERAEAMIRVAVAAEPRNASYLDSLGWVLYKRGKFTEAVKYLEQSAGADEKADPIVLDHLGDAAYQLKQATDAVGHWRQSLARVNESATGGRRDLQDLKLKLLQKIKQIEAGQSVNVAPVASVTKSGPQARSGE